MFEEDYIDELFDKYDPDELLEMMFNDGLTIDEFRDKFRSELRKIAKEEDDGR